MCSDRAWLCTLRRPGFGPRLQRHCLAPHAWLRELVRRRPLSLVACPVYCLKNCLKNNKPKRHACISPCQTSNTHGCVSVSVCVPACVCPCVSFCARFVAAYAHHATPADPRELLHARTDNMRPPKNAGRATTGRPKPAQCQAAWSAVKLRHPAPCSAREADRGDGYRRVVERGGFLLGYGREERASAGGSCKDLAWLCVRRASAYLFWWKSYE